MRHEASDRVTEMPRASGGAEAPAAAGAAMRSGEGSAMPPV